MPTDSTWTTFVAKLLAEQKDCPPEFLDYMNEHLEYLFA